MPSPFAATSPVRRAPAKTPAILLIDDNPDDRALAIRVLQQDDPAVRIVEITTAEAFEQALADGAFDAAVTDYQLRWSDGMAVLRRIKDSLADCPVILFTDSGSEEIAVAAMKAGADDYVIKVPRRARRLATAVRLARERAQLRLREQEALSLRDAFLLSAAHELRTPLTSVLGYLELFQERVATGKVALGDRDRRMLDVILRQAAALGRRVEDLGDAARFSMGSFRLRWQPVDLSALAQRVADDTEPLLGRHSHTLDVAGPPDPLVVQGDPLRLEQVLGNLLHNAVEYSPSGGRITVALMQSGPHAYLSVTDRGIGIPTADQDHVFERFFRAGNINPLQMTGFGLGLYVTRTIVELHGGTITVRSVEGHGSTFTVRLPLALRAEP